jgi:hypothetical protein
MEGSAMNRLAHKVTCVVALVAWSCGATSAIAEAPSDRYKIDTASSQVTDLRTGLIWQQPISSSFYTWDQATTYCRGLRIGTATFRLPTFKELMSLVDPTRSMPAIDVRAFPNTVNELFWTASNRGASGPAAISFATGISTFYRATDSLRVRCVR